MKKFLSFAAFALLMTATCFSFVACGDDDDDDNGEKSKFETKEFTVGEANFKMVAVEGGTFTMGAASTDEDAFKNERPQHEVTLSDYYIGETEVTQALWKAVMDGECPSYFKGDNLPVEDVSWETCQMFIKKLNKVTGKKFRFPTEAEWEYAARGGKKSKGKPYGSGSNNPDTFWYSGNSNNKTHPVGSNPNELGLCDMSGNVLEWCADWYGEYTSKAQINPTGPSTGTYRVYRGGAHLDTPRFCRVSFRGSLVPSGYSSQTGLRLAMSK